MSNQSVVTLKDALQNVLELSNFGRHLLGKKSWDIEENIVSNPVLVPSEMLTISRDSKSDRDFYHILRLLRSRVLLQIMIRDLSRLGPLEEFLGVITAFADQAVLASVDFYKKQLEPVYGLPRNLKGEDQYLHVIGMGKLGGKELNVSSDIDLIFLYPEDGYTDGVDKITNKHYFSILSHKVIASLEKKTKDGRVFRVDTRLRPHGLDGSLAVSFRFLSNYFYNEATPWDRLAWVKSRLIAGNKAEDLKRIVIPFVFRKYFDFSVIEHLRNLHLNIQRKLGWGKQRRNIKLGYGGIREIEFIVQVIQLVRGGYNYQLRGANTLDTLDAIRSLGLLSNMAVEQLKDSYVFLRNLEHRLMYQEDRQTQTIPWLWANQKKISKSMGYNDIKSFRNELELLQNRVNKHFRTSFWRKDLDQNSDDLILKIRVGHDLPDYATNVLQSLGFIRESEVINIIRDLRVGGRYQKITDKGKRFVDLLIVETVRLAASEKNSDQCVINVINLLEKICGRESYLSLLIECPIVLRRIVKIANVSTWGINLLANYPMLLAELDTLDDQTQVQLSTRIQYLKEDLKVHESDIEAKINILQHFKNSQTLILLNQDLQGVFSVENISDGLTRLADLLLEVILNQCWNEISDGNQEFPDFAIIGYGKLGSKEIGYMSDLDLIFLYSENQNTDKQVYKNLARRVCSWLSRSTTSEPLYDVDLQLRPHGTSGLLVTSIEAYQNYLFTDAWIWEHQALTKARAVAGNPKLCVDFEDLRKRVISLERNRIDIINEIIPMRTRMLANAKTPQSKFDVKNSRGGLIDVEFCVQTIVLTYSSKIPEFTSNLGNIGLLQLAASENLIPINIVSEAVNAYRKYRRLQHVARLCGHQNTYVSETDVEGEVSAVEQLIRHIF